MEYLWHINCLFTGNPQRDDPGKSEFKLLARDLARTGFITGENNRYE